jgi:hypothetical protein
MSDRLSAQELLSGPRCVSEAAALAGPPRPRKPFRNRSRCICGASMDGRRPQAQFCSDACRARAWKEARTA